MDIKKILKNSVEMARVAETCEKNVVLGIKECSCEYYNNECIFAENNLQIPFLWDKKYIDQYFNKGKKC